jgi:hypothetical protein
MWPFWGLQEVAKERARETLNSAEYTVYVKAIEASTFHAVLNEKPISEEPIIELPNSIRDRIIPDTVFKRRRHPDLRIARRAQTIAKLAQVISERAVQTGLRQTLVIQARRLEHLARQRLGE